MRKSSSHNDMLILISTMKRSKATSGLRGKFETGPKESMSKKYLQLWGEPPIFQSLINNLYDAQKVGNKNSENILMFLAQEPWYQLPQLWFTDSEALK